MLVHVLHKVTPIDRLYPETRERIELLGVFASEADAHKACAPYIRNFWLLPSATNYFTAYTPVAGQSWAFNQDQILEHALTAAVLVIQGKYTELYAWWISLFTVPRMPGAAPFYLTINEREVAPSPLTELSSSRRMAAAYEVTNAWIQDGKKKCRVLNKHTNQYELYAQEEK